VAKARIRSKTQTLIRKPTTQPSNKPFGDEGRRKKRDYF
jgi:hypothetical protein